MSRSKLSRLTELWQAPSAVEGASLSYILRDQSTIFQHRCSGSLAASAADSLSEPEVNDISDSREGGANTQERVTFEIPGVPAADAGLQRCAADYLKTICSIASWRHFIYIIFPVRINTWSLYDLNGVKALEHCPNISIKKCFSQTFSIGIA